MRRCLTVVTSVLAALGAITGCEAYDAAPEPELVLPLNGKWLRATPLELKFTEPIAPDSLEVSLWPYELDFEGDLAPGLEPLVEGCTLAKSAASACGEVKMTLAESGDRLTITHGALFEGREGRPFILDVEPGLRDLAGVTRKVAHRFKFQINPEADGSAVEISLNTGVVALFSDMSETLPGVFLRLFVDLGIVASDGTTWIAATVAKPLPGQAPNAADPAQLELYHDQRGWAVFITGAVSQLGPGKFFLQTEPFDLRVKVLGLIPVGLINFRLELTIWPGLGDGGRDKLEGFLTADRVEMGEGADLENLGAASAPCVGSGMLPAEIPADMPRLCAAQPCAGMRAEGGDCQLAEPWTPGPACP